MTAAVLNKDKDETYTKIISVIGTVLVREPDAIAVCASFNELGMDSLDKIEIVMRLEEIFNIHIDDDRFEHIASISDAVDYVHSLCQ